MARPEPKVDRAFLAQPSRVRGRVLSKEVSKIPHPLMTRRTEHNREKPRSSEWAFGNAGQAREPARLRSLSRVAMGAVDKAFIAN